MAETYTLETKARKLDGSRGAQRVRKEGLVPAVLYGHKEDNVFFTISQEEIEKAIHKGAHVIDLKTDGKTQKALIREVQWDHLGMALLHVDFARVSDTDRVHVTVPIEIRGTAPGIAAGGVLDQPMHAIEVECLAIAIPNSIRVNVAALQLEQAIHVKELTLPEGVKSLAEPDAVVVQCVQKQLEEEAAVVPGAEGSEPEVIGKKVAEEEEEAK
jgi:large subunit ribosomal protein L25